MPKERLLGIGEIARHLHQIYGRNTLPVRLEKNCPRRMFSSSGGWIDAMFAQHVRDRAAANVMP